MLNMTITKLRKWKRIFGWLFLFSIVLFIPISLRSLNHAEMPAYITSNQDVKALPPSPSLPELPILISTISLLTSLTSLAGFLSATILAWRKEKRETLATDLEAKKKLLEIEKLQKELKIKAKDHRHDNKMPY